MKLTIDFPTITGKRLEKLVDLGCYGGNPCQVVEYLVQREIDDMLRSPGLKDYLKQKPTKEGV